MKKVVLYCRVSTKEQEKGNSLDWQEDYLRRYCELKGYEVVTDVYREDKSGKNFKKRDKFQALMKYCKANKNNVDMVLVYRWDRYSRDLKEALINLDFFQKLNIEVNSVEQHIDFSTPDHITFLALYIGMAQSENNKISRRTREGIHGALEKGKCSNKAPRGYVNRQIDKDNKYVEFDKDKAPIIRAIFKEVAEGIYSPNFIRLKYARMGVVINKNSFMDMLRNRFYVGEVFVPEYKDDKIGLIKGHHVDGLHEPLIDLDVFDRVQELLDGKKRKVKLTKTLHPDIYLRGFLKCPVCGASMTGGGCKGNGGKYYYYNCSTDGKHFRYNAVKANDLFCKYVATLKPNNAVLELYKNVLDEIQDDSKGSLRIEIGKLEQELVKQDERLTSIDMRYMDNDISSEDYDRMKKHLLTAKQNLQERISLMRESIKTNIEPKLKYAISLINNLDSYMEDAPVNLKCKIVGAMFPEKIEFDGYSYRTDTFNSVLDLIYQQTNQLRGNKKAGASNLNDVPASVPGADTQPVKYRKTKTANIFINQIFMFSYVCPQS